jgi:hypothetical protein
VMGVGIRLRGHRQGNDCHSSEKHFLYGFHFLTFFCDSNQAGVHRRGAYWCACNIGPGTGRLYSNRMPAANYVPPRPTTPRFPSSQFPGYSGVPVFSGRRSQTSAFSLHPPGIRPNHRSYRSYSPHQSHFPPPARPHAQSSNYHSTIA